MKIACILLIIFNLQARATVYSQTKITLSLKSAELKKVLSLIEKQSSYHFLFSDRKFQYDKRVDVVAENEDALQVLTRLLSNTGFTYYELNNQLIVITKEGEKSDRFGVSGKVVSESGSPLAGASVKIKGSNIGTTTDDNGLFNLNVEAGAVLEVSFLGYETTEITVRGDKNLTISLKSASTALTNVVVTALGIKKEDRKIGYSLTEVKGEEVQITREPTFINALAGKVAGLVVQSPPTGAGGSSRLILRGYSSLNGSNQPLYVIDGVPIVSNTRENNSNDGGKVYGGTDPGDGLSSINPDDIETISVLKGASAAALYGSYAQAGVIIITTKKGKKNQGLGISFNSNTVVEKMVPYDEKDLQYEYGRGVGDTLYTAAGNIQNNNYLTALSWGPKIQGQSFLDVDGKIKPYVAQKSKDQFNRFFNTGVSTTNSLALTAASETGSYRLSLSQTKNKSPIPNSNYERYNAVFRATNDFGKRFHTDVKMDVSRTIRNNIPILRGDDRGSFSKFFVRTANTTDVRLLNQRDSVGGYKYLYTNPYVAIQKVLTNETSDRVLASANLTYDITDHFHAQLQAGIDKSNINGYFAVLPNNKANNSGLFQKSTESRERDNVLAMLSYDNNFGKFSLRLNGGVQMDYAKNSSTYITGTNFVDSSLLSLTNVTVNGGGITPTDLRDKTYSVFGAAQLGYDNVLFLELTGRNDWYSTLTFFDKSSFDNSLFYPSANLSYVFSESLKIPKNILSYGKLRAAVGQTGGHLPPYLTNLTYTIQSQVNGLASALISSNTLPPSSVKPEVTTEYELGTELKFFNSRLGLDFAWYKKTTKDFLISSVLSSAAGFTAVALNAGSMENKGVEILLTGTPVQTRRFSWDVSINAAKNKNTVLSLAPELAKTGISHYYVVQSRVGYPMGSLFGASTRKGPDGQDVYRELDTNSDGVNDVVVHEKGTVNYDGSGQPVKDPNGQPVVDNSTFLGSANPDWTGGITNTFTFGNVSLSFLIDGQFGGYLYEDGARWGSFFGNTKASTLGREGNYIPKGVVNSGTVTDPVFTANKLPFSPYQQYNADGSLQYGIDELNVFKKTFIKFRQISLGYSIPSAALSKAGIKSIVFSLIARNLFYFKKDLPIFDPQSSDSINNGFGYDSGGLPSSRTYGFNLNLRF